MSSTTAETRIGLPLLATRVFLPFAAGYFLSYLFRSVNAVIAPDLARSIALDAGALGLLTSAYFLTFAAAQLPLGILLDRFGPRRVEAALLLFAAGGAVLFAAADGVATLVAGRALVGLGVSACLMAAFKSNVMWFPKERLPLANGLILACGGMGALTATAPVEAALAVTDWRGVFLMLAAATAATAAIIFFVVPERGAVGQAGSLRAQVGETARLFRDATFWRYAPMPMVSQAAFMAIQGLWAGPWLRDVAGLDRGEAATCLMALSAAMVAGFVLMGTLAERLGRLGIKPITVATIGMCVFMANQATIVAGWTGSPYLTWIVFGFFGTSGTVTYAALSQHFPAHLAGRVNTSLNLLVFVAAFAAQWGMGGVIDAWRSAADGYPPVAYQAAFGTMLVLQFASLLWFLAPRRRAVRR